MENIRYPFADKFLRKNLEASEKGTEDQQDEMAGIIALEAQILGELGDILGGRRTQKQNRHHRPKELTDRAISGIKIIVDIRKEIGVASTK